VLDPSLAQFVAGGVLGSLAKVILESDGHLAFPSIEKDCNGRLSIYMGVFGNVLVGVVTALVVDHSFYVAVFSSITGSYLLEKGSSKLPQIMHLLFDRGDKVG
jgi:hypothetical protein